MLTATRPRTIRGTLLLAALSAVLLGLLPAPAANAGAAEDADFVARLNSARAAAGLPALAVAGDLTAIATAQSQRMAASNSLYHNPDLAQQVTGWLSLAENVGYGGSVEAVHDAFMNSAGHRANILGAAFTEVGIGTAVANGRVWVTQVFRKPQALAWTPQTPIDHKWYALGLSGGLLGAPVTPESGITGGAFRHFQGGSLYVSSSTPASLIRGSIRDTWGRLGWERSALGFPTTDELGTPDGRGRYNHFQGGSIYWSPGSRASEVRGAVRDTWARLGWERSALGYPVTDELPTPDGRARYNHFQGGSIYWSPATGAREVRGAIRGRWSQMGWEAGPLGLPVTDELPTPDGRARYNHFQGGSVYWSPATGAHDVRGAILQRWASLGWEQGRLGLPVSDEYAVPGGRRSDFQGGSIVYDNATGRTTVL